MEATPASDIIGVAMTFGEQMYPQLHAPSLGEVGLVLITVGAIAGLWTLWTERAKKREEVMVLADRNQKEHELLLDIFTDGMLDALVKEKISKQRANALLKEIGIKLQLYDLLPKHEIAPMVKATLKRDKYLRAKARKEAALVKRPLAEIEAAAAIPAIVKPITLLSQRIGRSADRFLKKAS